MTTTQTRAKSFILTTVTMTAEFRPNSDGTVTITITRQSIGRFSQPASSGSSSSRIPFAWEPLAWSIDGC